MPINPFVEYLENFTIKKVVGWTFKASMSLTQDFMNCILYKFFSWRCNSCLSCLNVQLKIVPAPPISGMDVHHMNLFKGWQCSWYFCWNTQKMFTVLTGQKTFRSSAALPHSKIPFEIIPLLLWLLWWHLAVMLVHFCQQLAPSGGRRMSQV